MIQGRKTIPSSKSTLKGNKIEKTVLRTTCSFPFYYRTDRTSPRPKAVKEERQGDPATGGQYRHIISKLPLTRASCLGAYWAPIWRSGVFHAYRRNLETCVSNI